MRVVTWNMGFWQHQRVHRAAWTHLGSVVQADIALLQETRPPTDRLDDSLAYREFDALKVKWGSAVVAFDGATIEDVATVQRGKNRSFPLVATSRGAYVVARASFDAIAPVTFVSIHNVTDPRYFVPGGLRIVADLMPLFDSPDGQRVILGGDLNLGTDIKRAIDARRSEAVLRAIETLGLVNLYERVADRPPRPEGCVCARADCRHLTTRTGGGQFDHLYVSPGLVSRCERIVRFDDADTRKFSDHWPIAADFDFGPRASRSWDVTSLAREIGARHGSAAAGSVDEVARWGRETDAGLQVRGPIRWAVRESFLPNEDEPLVALNLVRDGTPWQSLIAITARGDVIVPFQYMWHAPFDRPEMREQVRARFNQVDGVLLDRSRGRPSFPLAVLAERLPEVLDILGWMVDETVGAGEATGTASPPRATVD